MIPTPFRGGERPITGEDGGPVMQEAHIDHSQMERLVERLEQSPQVLKKAKRQAFEAAALKLQAAVQAEIGGSGKVRNWQGAYVGSKGGYAAARPKAETYTKPTKKWGYKYAVGYVTNAINSGHSWPTPSSGSRLKGYRAGSKSGWVEGKGFYEAAQARAELVAQEVGEQIVQALIDHLEG